MRDPRRHPLLFLVLAASLLASACGASAPVAAGGGTPVRIAGNPDAAVPGTAESGIPATPAPAVPSPAVPESLAAGEPPNLIVIVTDDQWMGTLSAMPNVRNLIGRAGTTFANAFVTTSLCCPSRASLLTGQYSHHHGLLDRNPPNGGATNFADAQTLPVWLQSAGYRTSLVGKYLNEYQKLPVGYVPPGWDDWHALAGGAETSGTGTPDTAGGYVLSENGVQVTFGTTPAHQFDKVITDRALEFVSEGGDEPFFLYYAPVAPHPPAIPAAADAGKYATRAMPRPPSFNEADVSDKPWNGTYASLRIDQIQSTEVLWRTSMESLLAVDREVGRLVRALETSGELDETAIVFTSDNGFMWGQHRLLGKVWPYEESIRVPLLVRAPGFAAGRTDKHLVTNVDVTATLLDLAGATSTLAPDGQSLVPLLSAGTPAWRSAVLIEYLGHNAGGFLPPTFSAIRTSRYTYVEYAGGGLELYDLRSDPGQLTNRAAEPSLAGVRANLAARLRALQA